MLPQINIQSYDELFWFVVVSLVTLAGVVVRALLKRDAEGRRADAEARARMIVAQDRIVVVLDNHLGEIGQHMAVSNETLRLISTRLLDEAFKTR